MPFCWFCHAAAQIKLLQNLSNLLIAVEFPVVSSVKNFDLMMLVFCQTHVRVSASHLIKTLLVCPLMKRGLKLNR